MLYRPSSSKKASRGFALATAAVIALSPMGANAQQATPVAATTNGITATTDCKAWRPTELMSDEKCEILKGDLIRTQNACIAELVRFKKDEPAKFAELGFSSVTRETACNLASRIPKRAASLQ